MEEEQSAAEAVQTAEGKFRKETDHDPVLNAWQDPASGCSSRVTTETTIKEMVNHLVLCLI